MKMALFFKRNFNNFLMASRLALPMLLAGVIGTITGLIIVLFVKSIAFSEQFFFGELGAGQLAYLGKYQVLLIPAIGGLIVGLLIYFFAPEAGGHGVPEVLKAIAINKGRMRVRGIITKGIASAISLGSGASTGREGPAVQIGAGIGSLVGKILNLSETRVKNLIACGTAAGISAVFNAPITGVMFALEIILKDFEARALSNVVVASVASSIISHIFLGQSPAFVVPTYSLKNPLEIFLYLGVGCISALAAVLFVYMMDKFDSSFEKLKVPPWFKPVIGGFLIGAMGIYFPQIFGMGFKTIESALHGGPELGVWLLFALVFLKMIATSVSLGSGSSGGTFAPTLFVGAMLGGSIEKFLQPHIPFSMGSPGAYALVGMVSVFSGAFHAPITAILLIFEMTGNYDVILPLMIASVAATSIAQLLSRNSMDTIKFKRSGINIQAIEEVRLLGALRVHDAMGSDFEIVPSSMTGKQLMEKLAKGRKENLFVVNPESAWVGTIKVEEIQKTLLEENPDAVIAHDLMSPIPEYCFSDDPLNEAAKLLLSRGMNQIPVVDPANPSKIVGILKSEHIFRAYTDLAGHRSDLISRLEQQHSLPTGILSMTFNVPLRSPVAGKTIKELHLSQGAVITSIKKRGMVIVPHGNTQLEAKDKVSVILTPSSRTAFEEWLKLNGLTAKS